jgi:hypothetical protein
LQEEIAKEEMAENEKANSFITLIGEVKTAVQRAQVDLNKRNLTVSEVELNLKTVMDKHGEGGFEFKIAPLDLGLAVKGKISDSAIQTITLKLVPTLPGMELESSPSDEINLAINAIVQAVDEALSTKPSFILSDATIELNFSSTKEGNADFSCLLDGGGNIKKDYAQTMKLRINGKDKACRIAND